MLRLWKLVLPALILALPAMAQKPAESPADLPQPDDESAAPVLQAMSSHHMDMGPHMKMTALREVKPGDRERADEIAWTARMVMEQYTDYKTALQDGFKIFLPNVPQKIYHFTNYAYGLEAAFQFNTEHPTSLLYEKTPEGYRLVGAMYTAPARFSEDELDERIPLSVTQWHQHVNFCLPPEKRKQELFQPHTRFGLNGTISTKRECDTAGGKFYARMFGWMVHVYPFERKPEDIWAVEPLGSEHTHADHEHMH